MVDPQLGAFAVIWVLLVVAVAFALNEMAGVVEKGGVLRKMGLRELLVGLRDEVGGYVHDTRMAKWIDPKEAMMSAGTWTTVESAVADVWCQRRAAADATFNVHIPIALPSNDAAQRGSLVRSIEVFWDCGTAAMDAVTAKIYKKVLPANTAAFAAPTEVTFDYDSGHDTAAKRLTLDQHRMVLTPSAPFWIDDEAAYFVELACDAAATSVFDFLGAKINYTARM